IPTQIGLNNQATQGRLMLYSETARKVTQGTISFGEPSAPANVLVGFQPDGGAVTPLLLLRGKIEMQLRPHRGDLITVSSNPNLGGGMYTVRATGVARKFAGGVQVLGEGNLSVFADALVYDGKPKAASVARGDSADGKPSVVTTLEDHGLAVGSSFQFSNL